MAEASVTIKLSPQEFDLVREAISNGRENSEKAGNDQTLSAGVRQKLRAKALLLKDLGQKLGA